MALVLLIVVPDAMAFPDPAAVAAQASRKKKSRKKRASASKKKRKSKRRSGRRRRRRGTRRAPVIQTLWMSPDSSSWVRKGRRGIIVYRDTTGCVRAMQPCSLSPGAGYAYASAINEYARTLAKDGVKVYMLMAPSQGEYYMPEGYGVPGAEQRCILATASALDTMVTPVFVNDTLRNHIDEEIYNRTDHHWAPLGAYYAGSAFAEAAGVGYRPLKEYTPQVVRGYVGTMHKFSGDPEVKKAPEDFIYFMPPTGYKAEFVNYSLSGGRTVGETPLHEEIFFKHYPDGSGAAYLTFMGGDTRTVKVSQTGGTPGRRLLIVKDSFGNAMASNLFGSFEEVHVVDFRYFPHNLADYVRRHGVTDMVFVNCVALAVNPKTAARLRTMLLQGFEDDSVSGPMGDDDFEPVDNAGDESDADSEVDDDNDNEEETIDGDEE